MKTLVTHINPHADDIMAIWLFRRFQPNFKGAKIDFISAGKGNDGLEETDDLVYLGVGRGRFDEHKGDTEDCATTLVWKYLKEESFAPKDQVKLAALEELVGWERLVDLGRLPVQQYDDFSVPAFIRPDDSTREGSLEAVDLGEKIFDRILNVLIRKHQSEKEWRSKIEFESRFGKSYAISGSVINRAFCKSKGGDLFLMFDPKKRWAQYFTPNMDTDLESIYQKLKQEDPKTNWFLHQSHHMVIAGSDSSPDSKGTNLTFEQLIDLAKSI